jgi:hypothetical protein
MFWSRPSYFNVVERRGWRVLPGTDPLPLVSESARPGKFGFALAGTIDWMQPGNSIKALLDSPTPLRPYGQLETPLRFVWNQVSLRLQKAI